MTVPINCTIDREPSTNEGTFGIFSAPELNFECLSLELPDRNNTPSRSRIDAGIYSASWEMSPRKKRNTYRLQDKNGRVGVLIHPASFAGDELMGYESDLEGCIALGEKTAVMQLENGEFQQILTGSRRAVRKFEQLANGRPLVITIKNQS
jgi:hypothetical protein